MRIALVGPTHPLKGGVAAHTTATAHELVAAGHQVDLVSWSRMYPRRLYPGQQEVPGGDADLPPFPGASRLLRWDRPGTWWRAGRRLRGHDLVVLVMVIPAQAPALLAVARAARGRLAARGYRASRGARRPAPRVVALAHNVVPHETHPGGRALAGRLLRSVDAVLVHTDEQAALAMAHGARRVRVAAIPPHLPGGPPPDPPAPRPPRGPGDPVRVLALGIVRDYKGIDLLLQAVREVPGVRVTVAGEQWGRAGQRVRELAAEPALAGRVRLLPGYLPAAQLPQELLEHDVMALPYRSGTASQNVLLAHAYGLPVLATRVGAFGDQVRDGVDGLVVPPGDVAALADGLRRVVAAGGLEGLRAGVPRVDPRLAWQPYLEALTALAGPAGADPSNPTAADG